MLSSAQYAKLAQELVQEIMDEAAKPEYGAAKSNVMDRRVASANAQVLATLAVAAAILERGSNGA